MYHGVGDGGVDPWELFISEDRFAEHLDVIRSFGQPIDLADLTDGLETGVVANRSVAVTFDDGYANNLHVAAPLLRSYGVPATVFAVAETIGAEREFWWDELAKLILTPGDLPDPLSVDVAGETHSIELGATRTYDDASYRADRVAREGDARSARVELYHRLWQLLVEIDPDHRSETLVRLAATTGQTLQPRETHRVMTRAELLDFDRGEGTSVGAHTMTHPILPKLPVAAQRREIEGSFADLSTALQRPVDTFSYPFGAHDADTMAVAAASPARVSVTVEPRTVCVRSHPHAVPRFDVRDWPADVLARRLERWWRFL